MTTPSHMRTGERTAFTYNRTEMERLAGVLDTVLPARFTMTTWWEREGEDGTTDCNTVGCIAGWYAAITLSPGDTVNVTGIALEEQIAVNTGLRLHTIARWAEEGLGMNCDALFYVTMWPRRYRDLHNRAPWDGELHVVRRLLAAILRGEIDLVSTDDGFLALAERSDEYPLDDMRDDDTPLNYDLMPEVQS